jgi:hypothetical protein
MATDSVVVVKNYAELITGASYSYSAHILKSYADVVTQRAQFPYQAAVSKLYVEIVASVALTVGPPKRRIVKTQLIRAR